jgi:hypothetical protein
MLRALGQSMLAVVLIFSARWYPIQELLFWVAIVAVLCGLGTIVIAVISWLPQIIRRGFRGIQRRSRGISRPSMAPIATCDMLSHLPRR